MKVANELSKKELEEIEFDTKQCKKCKKKLLKDDYIYMGYCESCFNKFSEDKVVENQSKDKVQSYVGVSVISFLIPLLGLMGYITHINSDYTLAKKCLSSAIWGIIIGAIALLIIFNM